MSANDPAACVDHYLFWSVEPQPVDLQPRTKGQFDQDHLPTLLSALELVGNPVRKERPERREEDIHQPSVHLLAYAVRSPRRGPQEPVIIRNQFTNADGERWQIGVCRFLLVPARKSKIDEPLDPTPPPPRVDHFLCYEVIGRAPTPQPLRLTDQFTQIDTKELHPLFLGVPVNKNAEQVIHPDVHLAIYELQPQAMLPEPIAIHAIDQFRLYERLEARQSVWLGVPSFKEWKPARRQYP
jgi:hypothetical protein